jgi:epothilone synthetase B
VSLSVFLNDLVQQGVQLRAEGGELQIRAARGALSREQRERLGRDKQQILELLRRHAVAAESLPPIVPHPAARHRPFPLTDIQQAYWLGRQGDLELGGVGCHLYREFERTGLDLARLELAWQRLVARHEMLRVVVSAEGEQQVLASVPRYRLGVLDLRGLAPARAAAALGTVREHMSHRVYAPDRWPLFDLRASRLDGGRTRLHLSLDLLAADAASILLLLREWGRAYEDPESVAPPPELGFRDYVLATLAWRGSARHTADEAYWQGRLDELPPAPRLPLARQPAALGRPRFVRRGFRLPAAPWMELRRRGEQAGVTPSALLCAAFAEVLAAFGRSSRFTLVLTLFRRLGEHPELQQLVGDFTSTLPLAVDASGGAGFADRARRLQARLAEDLDHWLVSGVQVLRMLHRRRREGSLLPVVFTSTLGHRQETPGAAGGSPLAWLGETVHAITQTPQVWLDHHVVEEEGELVLAWDAVEGLFPPGLLDDMFESYAAFVRRLALAPEAWHEPIAARLPAWQLAERAAANATGAGEPPRACLHGLFAARAAALPERLAVVAGDRALTYRGLAAAAARLAARLRRRGVRRGDLVAVLLEKGWEQAVAVLAIHACGAAYLPVEPALPAERRDWLLAHGGVAAAVAAPDLALAAAGGDEDEEAAAFAAAVLPDAAADLAYVIYTSGSTGAPKGVAIDHRGAAGTILDLDRRFAVGPEDRVLALSSLSFDLSVYDLFGMLAAGGTVVMPPAAAHRDPASWLALLARHRVTVWNSVPALLEMLVEHAEGQGGGLPESLRLVLLSGDWIPVGLPARLRALAPRARVVSLGGATEASIWSVVHEVTAVDPAWTSIPYGRPLGHQSCQVLDDRGEPCAVWVPGELHIGGAGLALGYWRDPALTAERFVPDPAAAGRRLYRTGDLGRYLPGGDLELLGREDLQVKILGHRIELGEIESALEALPRVRSAVVAAVGEPRGARRLVAYVVPAGPDAAAERAAFTLGRPGLRAGLGPGLALPAAGGRAAGFRRRTHRRFLARPVPLAELAGLLDCLAALEEEGAPLPRYRYPSAGSLYPVQTYLEVGGERVEGLAAGTYYYHPVRRELLPVRPGARVERSAHAANNRAIFDQAAFSLYLVGWLPAIAPLYGEAARVFCAIEAGCMLQLLMTEAAAGRLGLCPVGWMDEAALAPRLALGEGHVFLHAMLGGLAAATAAATAAAAGDAAGDAPGGPAGDEVGDGLAAAAGGPAALVPALRQALARKLPEALIPTQFVLLDALPLSANGKVDRRALPPPPAAGQPATRAVEAPATAAELLLAELARQCLGAGRVGLDDNLFDLGATSLHVVKLHRRVCEALAADFPVSAMFRHPTLRALGRMLAQGADASRVGLDGSRQRAAARLAVRGQRRALTEGGR